MEKYLAYKKSIEDLIIDCYDNIDLGEVDIMMKIMDYKVKRHFLNGRTPRQAFGYIKFSTWKR